MNITTYAETLNAELGFINDQFNLAYAATNGIALRQNVLVKNGNTGAWFYIEAFTPFSKIIEQLLEAEGYTNTTN